MLIGFPALQILKCLTTNRKQRKNAYCHAKYVGLLIRPCTRGHIGDYPLTGLGKVF